MNICPKKFTGQTLDVSSAWRGLENYIPSIIEALDVKDGTALEFGIDEGYSAHVFSQLFQQIIGVDTFEGDEHINHSQGDGFYKKIVDRFADTNVRILKSDYKDFIYNNTQKFDLIHIDIVHRYVETFECAEWSVAHSNVVLLHDTVSFPEIARVCVDIANKYNLNYYNIPEHFGLGILFK